jgi:hypothetical protein
MSPVSWRMIGSWLTGSLSDDCDESDESDLGRFRDVAIGVLNVAELQSMENWHFTSEGW